MSALIEMAAQLVMSQVSHTHMTTEQIISDLNKVHKGLKNLESEQPNAVDESKTVLTIKEAFLKNEVVCMVCSKRGFKTLGRHLSTAHDMTPKEYRKQFDIPSKQPLAAKSYSQARRKSALDHGLADNLARARGLRLAKVEAQTVTTVEVEESPVAEMSVAVGS